MEIAEITSDDLAPNLDELAKVYYSAFSEPPYAETEAAAEQFVARQLPLHAERPGFRLCVSRAWPGGPIAGFAYGYAGMPGQWWYETVSAAIGPALTTRWMADYFELVELAVTPGAQRQGFGGALHDALLRNLPHRTAMLTAYPDAIAALRLYTHRDWQTVRERLTFPGTDRTRVLLGREFDKVH